MGCDYYTYYRIRVELTDKSTKQYVLEDTRERHYWTEFVERDEDFESDEDYHRKSQECCDRQIEGELARYTTKNLYKDGKWLCVESSIKKYRDILAYLKVSEKDIVRIWKEGGAELR
jgi:hypothetical protein